MPILKHAKKKLRQDKKRTVLNKKVKATYKELIKAAKLEKTDKAASSAFSSLDKAAKHHIIHKNKAARLKASIAKALKIQKATISTTTSKGTKKGTKTKKSSSGKIKS